MIGMGIGAILILTLFLLKPRFNKKITAESVDFKTNEQYYQSLYQQNPDLILTFDVEGNFLSANRTVEFYGYKEEEILHLSFIDHVVPDQVEKTLKHFHIALEGKSTNYDTSIYNKAGERYELNVTNLPIILDDQIVGVYGILKDITEYKRVQEALTQAESKYRTLAEDSLVGIYIIQEERFVYTNQKTVEMLKCSEAELLEASVLDFVYPEDRALVIENIDKRLSGEAINVHYQYRAMRKDQTYFHVEVHGSMTLYNGKPAVIGTFIDITARKEAEATIEYMAYHDTLTGLSNRYHFQNRLEATLSEKSTESVAVLFINLDRFKQINESMGHAIGDHLLKAVADRLKEGIGDSLDFARNVGDEFIFSFLNVNQQDVEKVAQCILANFVESFQIDQYELSITPSIGISLYHQDGEDAETLMKNAYRAMDQVKR